MRNPLSPNLTVRPCRAASVVTSTTCSVRPSKSLPLLKYQSETLPAIARAAVELPP